MRLADGLGVDFGELIPRGSFSTFAPGSRTINRSVLDKRLDMEPRSRRIPRASSSELAMKSLQPMPETVPHAEWRRRSPSAATVGDGVHRGLERNASILHGALSGHGPEPGRLRATSTASFRTAIRPESEREDRPGSSRVVQRPTMRSPISSSTEMRGARRERPKLTARISPVSRRAGTEPLAVTAMPVAAAPASRVELRGSP